MLGRKRKEADVFDEPDFEEQASRIPTEEQKQNKTMTKAEKVYAKYAKRYNAYLLFSRG